MLTRTLCPILVGRDDEIAALEEALRAARHADGRVVLVTGDAGIGKTRLVSELCRLAEADGLPVLRGGCSEADLQVPYLPFIEAIRAHARGGEETAEQPELRGLFGTDMASSADPTRQRVMIFEGVVGLLERVAGDRGAVLVVEDLHWADSGTRDLLDYVARSLRGSRVLVVATYRADEVDRRHPLLPLVRGWERRNLATTIELRPLTPDGIEAMLAATVGEHDAGLSRRLHERCEGNPFVLEEILKASGSNLAEPVVPATVRDVILRRVERLDGPHLEVLRAAAVLGEPIDDGILVDLLGDAVPGALEECAREQLLTTLADGSYAWRHALTREAVYRDMAPARRRRLHSELADLCDGRPGVADVTICGHLAAADRWDAAVPRCRQAAAQATAIGAFADAARLLELSLAHVDERSGLADILGELSELLMQSGRPADGEVAARRALELRGRQGDVASTAAARRTLALCLWQQARWAEAIIVEDRAIVELEALAPTPALVAALARRASWAVLAEGDTPAAVALVERARRVATDHGFDPGLYRADEGQVIACAGRLTEGLAILDDGWRARLRPSGGRGSDWREGKFMLHHAVAFRNLLGTINDSLSILEEVPRSPAGQDAADTSLAVVTIEALWAHGEITRARRLLADLDLTRIERPVVPWAQAVRADVLHAFGDPAAAEIAHAAIPPHWQPISQLRVAGLVRVLVDAGDLSHALELADRLDPLERYAIDLRLPLIDAAVEANLAAGRLQEAERVAEQVTAAAAEAPLRLRVEARMLSAGGADPAALDRLRGAVDGFARTGHRQDEWRSRRLLARVLRNLGQRREANDELRRIDEKIAAAEGAERAGLPPAAPSLPERGRALSPREHEVAVLVAQGLRNREIGERLFISERTVENHIHRVLQRTGLRSRAELAAHVTQLSGELRGSPR